jgi:hypothetical protein
MVVRIHINEHTLIAIAAAPARPPSPALLAAFMRISLGVSFIGSTAGVAGLGFEFPSEDILLIKIRIAF